MNALYSWPEAIGDALEKGIVALFNDAIAATTVIGYTDPLTSDEGAMLVEEIREDLQKGAGAFFAIHSGDELIGMALLSTSSMPNCKHIANLSKGIIRSDQQKKGIVKEAFLEIATYCESHGYELITLDVRENSEPHQIWASIGFTEYGRLDDYARVDGVPQSGAFMSQPAAKLKARLSAKQIRPNVPLMDKATFMQKLRDELESRITMTHPVVQKIVSGEPHWELLRFMTLQGYQLTKHFLEYIETLYHHCPRGIHKRRLLMNMFEEETGRFSTTDNHVKLMENFIRAIGVSDEERDSAKPLPTTKELIEYRMKLVRDRRTFHMGAAAVMVASEGQNLETTAGQARHDLLPRVYNLQEKDLLFFSVHQKEDVGHVKEGISLVADICDTPKMQQEALEAVRHTCDLFYGMYAGVADAIAA
jgi:pyrroloquinoline quinone (PQQ) biosynthesis protein C/L-amino acid N-acyltransferase YncA